jgi:hypothetical protein
MAARSEARMIFDRSKTGIFGSNPARGMFVFPLSSVFSCPVWVVALRRAELPSKESYQYPKIDS